MFKKSKITKMETEIFEQTKIIPQILKNYIDSETGDIKIDLPDGVKKIVIVASGSSYHCARFAVDLTEKFSKIETRAIYSSEFLLKNIIPKDESTLYIFITQSGETSDTLKALNRVKNETDLKTLCITNNPSSSIWDRCDYKVDCHAGEEIGIAATKSFTSQILCLILITLKFIENSGHRDAIFEYKETLKNIPQVVEKALKNREKVKKFAKKLSKERNVVVAADGISYSLAKEAALKIKETSYINVSSAILGEFMHGHVAVLNNKSTFMYISINNISEQSIKNIESIKKDYAPSIAIIGKGAEQLEPDYIFNVETNSEILQLFANIVTIQLIALETALCLKRNVDSPKGLHKVVTDNTTC